MAVKLIANYSKKLGLPGYSSHSFGASVEVELTDLTQVEAECGRLYQLLQQSVDQQIQSTGFVPDNTYGVPANNGHRGQQPRANGHGHAHNNGNGHQAPKGLDPWNCTEGQRGFILRILSENNLDKQETEDLANQLFGAGVKQLNKMQASQLIEELLVKAGKPPRQNRWRNTQPQPTATPS
jgi:hypothetical protein